MGARAGLLLSVEGVDGAGKTTQVVRLHAALGRDGHEVVVVRPDSTALGAVLQRSLLGRGVQLEAGTEALLFTAGRLQLIRELIDPALDRGALVIADRFVDSTLAYQGWGRGLGADWLRQLHRETCADLWPDLTVLLRLPLAEATRRQRVSGRSPDRFESAGADFQGRVAAGFDHLAAAEPARFVVIDAAGPAELVAAAMVAAVRARLTAEKATRGSRRATP